ncbi:MAG: tetratricopeptide repeat protein [Balneolaceae bacterium]
MIRSLKNMGMTVLAVLLLSTTLIAQNNSSFQLATRFMQQQEYADALPLLKELNQNYPDTYVYADRLIDCLIQLKQYDEGLEITQQFKNNPGLKSQVQIKIGELYHYKNQPDKALKIWISNLEEHSSQLQLYINTARTMINRREYTKAVEVYKMARKNFQNERLFFSDIANAYMRAGEYESAIDEWLKLLKDSPNQISFIQRSLLRYDDPILYDITIVELNDYLDDLSISNPNYETFYQLQIWLLQENKLFRRALAVAKEYESRSNSYNYSLFNLGRQLIENNEFELAEEAFTYYTDRTHGEIKWRSLEELANTYAKWAKFMDDYNLDFSNKKEQYYRLSAAMLDSIEAETRSYSRMKNIQLKRAELALEHIYDLDKAKSALTKLKSITGTNNTPELPYLEGRIHLASKEFAQARIFFTRANKMAQIGELAEKTRYFLALTDFYSGDYEFATIQLKSLGRQSTSYYANDALELRLWLQQGLAIDSTGTQLNKFSEAVYKENNGQPVESAELFLEMVNDPDFSALKDDMMLFIVHSPHIERSLKFTELSNYLTANAHSPINEQLLWEQAKLTEQLHQSDFNNCTTGNDCISDELNSQITDPSVTAKDIYEKLILQYPQGFYAPYARERLTSLSNENS